jgi:hypothetical protein
VVAPLHGTNRGQHQLLRASRKPGAHRSSRTGQDIVIPQSSLPAFQVGLTGKSRAMPSIYLPYFLRNQEVIFLIELFLAT